MRWIIIWISVMGIVTGMILGGATNAEAGASLDGNRFRVEAGFRYTSGDYGTGTTTGILTLPMTLGYGGSRFDLSVTIPYIYLTDQTVFPTGGGMAPHDGTPTTGGGGSGMMGGGGGGGMHAGGLGDIWLDGRLLLLESSSNRPFITAFAKIKLPTADRDEGLGTGETDGGGGIGVGKRFGKILLDGEVGYIALGSPPGLTLRNVVTYLVRGRYAFTNTLDGIVALSGNSAVSNAVDPPAEIDVGMSVKFSEEISGTGYVLFGLTNGSPDVGLGGLLTGRF